MNYIGLIQAILAAILFGVSTPLLKSLLGNEQVNLFAGLLYLGAALCLSPLVWRRYQQGKTIFPHSRRNRWNLLGAVFFGGVVGPVLLLLGLRLTSAVSVSMWLNLEAVATAVLAVLLFREHLSRWTWLGNIGVVIAGLLLGYNEGWSGWTGLLCVTGAAIAWGLDNNFTAIIDGISPEDCTFWKGLIAGTTNLVIAGAAGPIAPNWNWGWVLIIGGLSYGGSIVLYIRASHHLGATRSQMIFSLAPFFGVAVSLLWLGEQFQLLQGIAALIMILSIACMFIYSHAHHHSHAAVTHEHEHQHNDLHHNHTHDNQGLAGQHSHVHDHDDITHLHPHWSDIHHRHGHI